MLDIQKCLRNLSNAELADLAEVVIHAVVKEEVHTRFKQCYEETAYAYYNSSVYSTIGNITELGIEDHSVLSFKEFAQELSPYINSLV